MPQIMAHANVLRVGETQKVTSSPIEVNWRQAANVENKADVISIVMDPNYVNELRKETNGYWRFANSERVNELINLGKMEENGYQYFEVVRKGGNKGVYCITKSKWLKTAPEDTFTLHVPSIKKAIKENKPLAVGGYDDDRGRLRLVVIGVYYEDGVARVTQLETGSEAAAPQATKSAPLTRVEANEVLSIGNIRLVVGRSNRKDSLEYANSAADGRRTVTEQDIKALSDADNRRLSNFLYDEWRFYGRGFEHGWFWLAGKNKPRAINGGFGGGPNGLVISEDRSDAVAFRVAYVEVAREAAAPQAAKLLRTEPDEKLEIAYLPDGRMEARAVKK